MQDDSFESVVAATAQFKYVPLTDNNYVNVKAKFHKGCLFTYMFTLYNCHHVTSIRFSTISTPAAAASHRSLTFNLGENWFT